MTKSMMSQISDLLISPAYASVGPADPVSSGPSSPQVILTCPPGRTITQGLNSYEKIRIVRNSIRLEVAAAQCQKQWEGAPTRAMCKPYVKEYLQRCNDKLQNNIFFGRTEAPDYRLQYNPLRFAVEHYYQIISQSVLNSAIAMVSDFLINPAYAHGFGVAYSNESDEPRCPDKNNYKLDTESAALVARRDAAGSAVAACYEKSESLGLPAICTPDLQYMQKMCQWHADDCSIQALGIGICIGRTRSVEITDFFKSKSHEGVKCHVFH